MKYLTIVLLALGLLGCIEEGGTGVNWTRIEKVSPERSFRLEVEVNRSRLRIGEAIEISARSERSGRLWVVTVDADDNVALLFPNDRHRSNAIPAGSTLRLPPSDASWELAADGPAGPALLAVIVTTGDADLRDLIGHAPGGERVTKGLRVIDEAPWAIVRRIIRVDPK